MAKRLQEYQKKRDFRTTPEPAGEAGAGRGDAALKFVVQKHAASRLHYDFRLEVDGVLKSWAVPKGPSVNPADKRLAVMTEDHPLEYADFEGSIPEDEYGGGTVIVWDRGTYRPQKADGSEAPMAFSQALEEGHAEFFLEGEKLQGGFVLVNARLGGQAKNWLLIKLKDDYAHPDAALTASRPESVISGRTIEDLS